MIPEAYLGPYQTSKMELFAKTVNGFSQKCSIIDRVLNTPDNTTKYLKTPSGFRFLI